MTFRTDLVTFVLWCSYLNNKPDLRSDMCIVSDRISYMSYFQTTDCLLTFHICDTCSVIISTNQPISDPIYRVSLLKDTRPKITVLPPLL